MSLLVAQKRRFPIIPATCGEPRMLHQYFGRMTERRTVQLLGGADPLHDCASPGTLMTVAGSPSGWEALVEGGNYEEKINNTKLQ